MVAPSRSTICQPVYQPPFPGNTYSPFASTANAVRACTPGAGIVAARRRAASPTAVVRVLKEAGYKLDEVPTHRHPDKVRRFERTRPNQFWQTGLFTFIGSPRVSGSASRASSSANATLSGSSSLSARSEYIGNGHDAEFTKTGGANTKLLTGGRIVVGIERTESLLSQRGHRSGRHDHRGNAHGDLRAQHARIRGRSPGRPTT